MPAIETRIDPRSEAFRRNRADMIAAIEGFRACEARVRNTSNAKRERFRARGQLLPRERVAAILDRGAPYLELATLAGFAMHDDDGKENVLGGQLIAGIGYVNGIRCMISATDSAIKGGTITPMGLKKTLRIQEIARLNKLPLVNLVESGGANLLYQAEIFIEAGRSFCNQARLSAAGIPQVTVMHGSATAGGAYVPGLSDYVVMVRNRAKVFLAGPPLLKAATGEIADDEALGGALMHTTVSGLGEYLAEDDTDGIRIAREILAKLPWNDDLPTGPAGSARPAKSYREPRYDPAELAGVVPADYRRPYDVHEVIARLVDDSDYLDFKPLYGPQTVCGHAEIEGSPCGLIGNNGPIDADGAAKAAQFIQLCCQSNIPLVYLQNTTGYMVGVAAEQAGIIKHGSKMIQAVANATVPQLTLHIGASFGAGNYGMCGRSYDPRFIFAWPNHRLSVMGSEQAARVMSIVTTEKFKRRGQAADADALVRMEDDIITRMDHEATPLYCTARLWDDGIIDPRDSRKVLAFCLDICREAEIRTLRPNHFGVARM